MSYTALVKTGKISELQLAEKMSKKPAEILRFKDKGEIKAGMDADIVIMEIDNEYVIEPSEFYSKAKFTPAKGKKVFGSTSIVLSEEKQFLMRCSRCIKGA